MNERQLPLETVFMSNSDNSWCDSLHPNRIHFRFPDSWSNDISKDAIIGIRDLYITKAFRKVKLNIEWRLLYWRSYVIQKTGGGTESGNHKEPIEVVSGDISIEKYIDDETKLKDLMTEMTTKFIDEIKPDVFKIENYFTDDQIASIQKTRFLQSVFEFNSNDTYFKIESPFNDLDESIRTTNNEFTVSNGVGTETKKYFLQFRIASASDDAINVLHLNSVVGAGFTQYQIVTNKIWDRNSCILYSNLAYMSEQNFLGHTRRESLNKLKYFTITSSNKTFWVDMCATCSHNTPVILPADKKDELYIEAQLLTSSNAVL